MFKPLPVAIGLRYLRAKRRNGFISFISMASILGIALGVAALITTLAVMTGFQREIRDRMLQMAAHATITADGVPLENWRQAVAAAYEDPRVAGAAPYVETEALLPVPIAAVVAAGHPLARRRKALSSADLADHLQIVLEDPTTLSQGRDFGVLSPETLRVGSQDAKRALILAGVGWGRLPQWAVARELADKQLVPLAASGLGQGGVAYTATYLARRTDQPLRAAASFLRDALLRRTAAASPAPAGGRLGNKNGTRAKNHLA